MKRTLLSLAVAVAALTFALPSQAQVKLGVKAGLNVSNMNFKNVQENIKADNRTGFFAGLTADFTIPLLGLGADASLLYDNKVVGVDDGHKTLHYIDLPLNVKYTLGFSSLVSVYAATGPQFSWNVGDRHWGITQIGQNWELNKSEFSWNAGFGATVLKHVRVGYNYNIALGSTAKAEPLKIGLQAATGKLKNNTHQISVSYLF